MRSLDYIGQHIRRHLPTDTEFDPAEFAAWKMCQVKSTGDYLGFQTGAQIVSEFLSAAQNWKGHRAHQIKLELEQHLSRCSWVMCDTTEIDDPEYKQAFIKNITGALSC